MLLRYLVCARYVVVLHVEMFARQLRRALESINAPLDFEYTYIRFQLCGNTSRAKFQESCEAS